MFSHHSFVYYSALMFFFFFFFSIQNNNMEDASDFFFLSFWIYFFQVKLKFSVQFQLDSKYFKRLYSWRAKGYKWKRVIWNKQRFYFDFCLDSTWIKTDVKWGFFAFSFFLRISFRDCILCSYDCAVVW